MINLKIDPEFQSQIPPLTDDEFKQLEENILKEGKLISPLIVWNNTLVDGHNRKDERIITFRPFSLSNRHLTRYATACYAIAKSLRFRYICLTDTIQSLV